MVMHGLFAQPIGMFDRQLTDEEKTLLINLETRPNTANSISVNNYVLRQSGLTNFRSWIENCVTDYFKATTNPKHGVNLRITQSWVNYSKQGEYHHRHTHPNSVVSGVFYIQTNPDDRINFYRAGYYQIKFTPIEWNNWNSESWWFPATTGQLIMFPSSLEHMVPTVQGEHTRISLSFNTFPVGVIGEDLELTSLNLEA